MGGSRITINGNGEQCSPRHRSPRNERVVAWASAGDEEGGKRRQGTGGTGRFENVIFILAPA